MRSQVLRITTILSALFAASFAPTVFAEYFGCMPQVCGMSAPYGWYLEFNIGNTKISNVNYHGSSSTSNSYAANLNAGYKFMPYFATEIGYTRYANTTLTDPITKSSAATIKHYSYDIAAKGIFPMSSTGFELFAKLGVVSNNAKATINNSVAANNIGLNSSNQNTTAIFYGLGGQYYFSPEAAFVVQWQRAEGNGNTGILDLYSIGVNYILA